MNQFGMFAMALAVVNIGIVVSLLGHENKATRLVASAGAGSVAHFVTAVKAYRAIASRKILVAGCVTAFFAVGAFLSLIGSSVEYGPILLIALLIPIVASTRFNQGIIRGAHYASLAILPDGVIRPGVAALILSLVLFVNDASFLIVALLMILSSLLALFLSQRWASSKIKKHSIDNCADTTDEAPTDISAGISYAMYFSSILAVASSQISVFLTGSIGASEEAAMFAAAERYAVATGLIGQAMYQASASRLAAFYATKNLSEMRRLIRNLTRLVFGTSLVAVLVVALGANFFLGLFGEEYVQAKVILWILLAGVLLNVSAGPVGFILLMTGNEEKHLMSLMISFGVLLILLFVLVPRYGGTGAASAVLISTLVWNIVMAEFIRRTLSFRRILLFA